MVATLKDVAAHAGVSFKTVSNVVNGYQYVTDETRERVLSSVAVLGYRPNLPARHLRKGRVGILALTIPDLANPYFSDIATAVSVAAAVHDYTILIDYTGGSRANESLVANGVRPHLIDGVILNPLALGMDDLQPDRAGAPIVLLGERLFGAPWDHVAIDNVAAARLATAHLLSLGRRRLAFIGAQDDSEPNAASLRLRGFTEALAAEGLSPDPQLIVGVPFNAFRRAEGAQAMRLLLALPHPPDAVFCYNDLLALGALHVLRQAGCRVPDEVAIAGFDDIEEGHFAAPSLTTISPDKAEIGRLAVTLLLDRVAGARTGRPERLQPSFRLVVRGSTSVR